MMYANRVTVSFANFHPLPFGFDAHKNGTKFGYFLLVFDVGELLWRTSIYSAAGIPTNRAGTSAIFYGLEGLRSKMTPPDKIATRIRKQAASTELVYMGKSTRRSSATNVTNAGFNV